MITLKVKKMRGDDLVHECSKLDDYTVSFNKHAKITNIHTGQALITPNREVGFGLWCAIKKQAKQIGIIIIPIILIMCVYLNGG